MWIGTVASSRQRPLVLVPGACLGGWVWGDVAATLRSHGHEVYPVTLTGLGERVHLGGPGVDLETHVGDVVNLLDHQQLSDVVLVGHSYSGTVVTAVADRRPERLGAVVYLDTSPLPDGTAIADVQSPEQRDLQRAATVAGGDGWSWPAPDAQTLRSGVFGSAGGLSEEQLRELADRATPHPYATFTTPVRLAGERPPPSVRRVANFCADGGTDLATVRDLIAAGHPGAAAFADEDWELHELPTGHWAMISLPDALAELLHEIAAG